MQYVAWCLRLHREWTGQAFQGLTSITGKSNNELEAGIVLSHNIYSLADCLYKGGSLRSCILCTPCG